MLNQDGKHVEIGDHEHERCQFLRWKGLFVEAMWDPTVQHGGTAFWCQHTYHCLGKDNEAVNDKECNPGRSCYTNL